MKTERVVLLTSPEFKAFLSAEARRQDISVAELVRSRFEKSTADPQELALHELAEELGRAVSAASQSLREGLAEADAALRELRSARLPRSRPAARARKAA
jgi:hypothetical protein